MENGFSSMGSRDMMNLFLLTFHFFKRVSLFCLSLPVQGESRGDYYSPEENVH
jgi:hypothetical protein